MLQRLKKILLIDDSESDNFIHKKRIEKADVCDEVIIKYSGLEGLQYLSTPNEAGKFPKPELVFLDINMPGMNGWEFLAEYQKLEEDMKANVVISMLTTSVSEQDRDMAKQWSSIRSFENKPLTEDKLLAIIDRFFRV